MLQNTLAVDMDGEVVARFEDLFGDPALLDDADDPHGDRVATASTECNEHRTLGISGKVFTTKTSIEQERKRKANTKDKICMR